MVTAKIYVILVQILHRNKILFYLEINIILSFNCIFILLNVHLSELI
jgi:hypothetical protein